MKLNETDMRAIHFLIVTSLAGELATPGLIAQHLDISIRIDDEASRSPHEGRPCRAASAPDGSARAHRAHHARNVQRGSRDRGRQQARRFYSAARLAPHEREVVIRFLRDMTNEIELTDARTGRASSEGSPGFDCAAVGVLAMS